MPLCVRNLADTRTMGLLPVRKIAGCACARNAGNVSSPPRVSYPSIHPGTCVTHVPWCMPGSLTNGFLSSRWWENPSRHPRHMRNPQFYVSGKGPMASLSWISEEWMKDTGKIARLQRVNCAGISKHVLQTTVAFVLYPKQINNSLDGHRSLILHCLQYTNIYHCSRRRRREGDTCPSVLVPTRPCMGPLNGRKWFKLVVSEQYVEDKSLSLLQTQCTHFGVIIKNNWLWFVLAQFRPRMAYIYI